VLADKRPVARVAPAVVSQMALGRESFKAFGVLALERLLPGVDAHVGLQVPSLCESLGTASDWTNKRLLSGLNVILCAILRGCACGC